MKTIWEDCSAGGYRPRLNRAAVDKEIALISSGLQWKRVEVGQSLPNRILTEYDAVFLAPGRWSFPPLAVPGSDLPQVASANIFLKDCAEDNVGSYDLRDKEAAIIGGGSTAIDAARACLEVGARRAIVVYRRGRREMLACSSEYLSAAEAGVEFIWVSNPVSVSKMGEGLSLELDKMTLGETDESGRRQPTPIGRRTSLVIDRVLVAVSSLPESSSLSGWPELEILSSGRPAARCTQNATVPKLFLGGDVIGAGTVVQAVADGKCAAERMHEWLSEQT